MQEETNGKNKAPAKDNYYENRTEGKRIFSKILVSSVKFKYILVEEQEPREKGVENTASKSHISRLSDNRWSLLGVMALIVAVLYPFKIFYE